MADRTTQGIDVSNRSTPAKRFSGWWWLLGTLLLPCLYLPTLQTRFDFVDDGNLVYAAPSMPLGQRLHRVWQRIAANFEDLGPFRPVLWAHWELQADLLQGDALRWRCVRFVWTMLATGAFLSLLRELGIHPWAALSATALAMWNPFRNEIWTSLTLAEGVAMPYAVTSLSCAIRAARSRRPGIWDLTGALCLLAAVGCKNVFAALVPAQLFLRIAPDGKELRQGFRRNGRRASLLALTLLWPVIHFVIFKLTWHPGQYQTGGPSWSYLGKQLWALKGALSLDYVGLGLALALAALFLNGWKQIHGRNAANRPSSPSATGSAFTPLWDDHRGAIVAGGLLLLFGVGIYLPIGAISARYTMPAVWGADLWIAALLSALAGATVLTWKRVAYAVFACGLVAVAVTSVGRQQKFAARAQMLWTILEYVEQQAPAHASIAWMGGPDMNPEEGVHFSWHLHNRGRADLEIRSCDEQGRFLSHPPSSDTVALPTWFISGSVHPPTTVVCQVLKEVAIPFWWSKRFYHGYLWSPVPASQP